jgi:excisionase family DNA binding protein
MKESATPARERLEQLLTPAEVADLARVSKKTVYREIKAGRLVVMQIRTHYGIAPADVVDWLESCRMDGGARTEVPHKRSKPPKVSSEGPGSPSRLRAIEEGS